MQRRAFLKGIGMVGATSLLPSSLSVLAVTTVPQIVNVKQLFNTALAHNPQLIGFANVENDFPQQTLTVEGKVPTDLQGVFYRNGPGKYERGDIRYQHLFEGDGMLQRFEFDQGKVVHHGKFINTPKFTKEQDAGRFLYSGPDTKLIDSLPVSKADQINTANTNIITVGDDMWALWEAGSPTKVDSKTLEFKEQVNLGGGSKYGNSLQGLAFSAHPKISPNGDIWNFGLNSSGHIVLYHLSANGRVKNTGLINAQYRGGMLHDFLMTDKHLLIILPSLFTDKSIEGNFASTQYSDNIPMRILVVSKQSLAVTKRYDLPAGFAFHYGNAWEETNGTLHFDASLYPNVDVLHKLSNLMNGQTSLANAHAKTAFYTLKPNGSHSMHMMSINSEFPAVCNHVVGLKNEYLYHLSSNEQSLWSDTVSSINTDTGAEQHFNFGQDYLVEEHISVCPKAVEGTGYLIGTALHVPSKRTCLNIFSANDLSSGPITQAWLPYHLPLGFHGHFQAS